MRFKNFVIFVCLFVGTYFLFDNAVSAREGSGSSGWHKLNVLATAYCPCAKCCGKWADGMTAIGRDASLKGVAVDKRIIPLRSTVRIPGYGTVIADDVGGAIKRERIDVRFTSHQEALNWGRKNITIYYKTP